MNIEVFTDGSANAQNKLGGCGAVILYEDGEIDIVSEGFCNTKTGRMEIMALLRVLQKVPQKSNLTVYSDSKYVCNAFCLGWLKKWIASGFVGIKNSDLWKEVDLTMKSKGLLISISHIKGHQKVTCRLTEGNNEADKLADYRQFTERTYDDYCE